MPFIFASLRKDLFLLHQQDFDDLVQLPLGNDPGRRGCTIPRIAISMA